MAKFSVDFGADTYVSLTGSKDGGDTLTVDDLLEVLRPAAIMLRDHYKKVIETVFRRRTGTLADSIDFEDDYTGDYAFFFVKPFGSHKGKYTRKSRAGDSSRKYAKHGRNPSTKAIKNEELAYLLEYGTPRIAATHWMENANEEIADQIQDTIDAEFTKLLQKKGLI